MAKDLAIVLNNGGLNSAVATALAAQRFRTVLLFADPGIRATSRARAAYEQQVAHFKPYREHTLQMPYLSALTAGKSATGSSGAAAPRQSDGVSTQMIELLPLLAAAGRCAAQYHAAAIFLGLRIGGVGSKNPDRNPGDDLAQATEFVQIWAEMLQLPCGLAELEIITPLLELEPWQVVDVGYQAQAPFDKAWSCMEEGAEPCWACRSCRFREVAFQQAAKPDPMRPARRP